VDPLVVIRDAAAGQWLRFHSPVEVVETSRVDEVLSCLRRVESLVDQRQLFAAGFLSYEAAPAFDPALAVRQLPGFPLLWFGLYQRPEPVELPRCSLANVPEAHDWQASMTEAGYSAAVAELRECIARGETYQVNYTWRLRRPWAGDPWQCFLRLVEAQQPPHGAFLDTPTLAVCSASPELFFRLDGQSVTARPMKGTAPRGRWHAEDVARAEWLAASEKNRAENAMIVDMMRNDLGRIARVGSVQVRDLFRTERYPTVWQMTSAVEAETSAPVTDILAALFPCASVTGAPKPNTMRIIARTETAPRGIYTGSIGWIAPGRRVQFNVAIRTLVIDKPARQAEYGTGGGVVWDSTPAGEYQECLLKARILTERRPEFSLLETLLCRAGFQPACPADAYWLLDEHMQRLAQSAEYFGFALDEELVRRKLEELALSLPHDDHRVRLLVSRDGEVSLEAFLINQRENDQPVRLELAMQPVASSNPFLYHKTTHRDVYEAARRGCTRGDDVLLYNERGEITETSIANVVFRADGQLWTPPLEFGLLPGVFRARLLAEGNIRERVLSLEKLAEAEELLVINSVRGWRKVQKVFPMENALPSGWPMP
jgi:para-aminobenzoate synthetase/4-amino-4-deoxychorismate lyase